MPDRGLPVEFGIFPSPVAADVRNTLEQVQLADRLGLDLVGIQDHPYQRRFLDTFALIGHLAAHTTRIRFFPDVAHLPLRPPAMLAKLAASLDVLSDGRFELGLGAGGFDQASTAMGAPPRTGSQKVDAVTEAIAILRQWWEAGDRGGHFTGEHYRLAGVKAGPPPAHDIGIWIGANGPRMLDLIGRLADGWVPSSPYAPPPVLAEGQRRIDEAAYAAGRDPARIRRVYNVNGFITDGSYGEWLHGPADHWVDELTKLVDLGMDSFVFWPQGPPEGQIEAWAEVAAAVRESVRASAGRAGDA